MNGEIATLISSVTWLLIGVLVATVLWKIGQLIDTLRENIRESKKP